MAVPSCSIGIKKSHSFHAESKAPIAKGSADREYIIPVKLEIKEFSDKENALYVAVALEGIKKTRSSRKGIPKPALPNNTLARLLSV